LKEAALSGEVVEGLEWDLDMAARLGARADKVAEYRQELGSGW